VTITGRWVGLAESEVRSTPNDRVEVITMLAIHPRVVDAILTAVEARLPEIVDEHPLGCHRRRRSDRECFEAILFRLVTGCSWDVAGRLGNGSETTLRRRRDEWLTAGGVPRTGRRVVAGLRPDHRV
jgi:Putative transposase of IS4/5 family (DUF4096)